MTGWCPVPVASGPKFTTTDHPVVQSILTTGAAVLIPDLSAHPDWGLSPEQPRAGSWMGVPLFARGTRGRAGRSGPGRGRLFQRRPGPRGRGDVVPGVGRGRERGTLRADAGLDTANAVALAPPRGGAGERTPEHLARAARRGGSVAGVAALRPASPGARDRAWGGRHRQGLGARADDRCRHRRAPSAGRGPATGEPRSPGARRGAAPVLAPGGVQVRPGGAPSRRGGSPASAFPAWWRRRSTGWFRRR